MHQQLGFYGDEIEIYHNISLVSLGIIYINDNILLRVCGEDANWQQTHAFYLMHVK